MPALIRFFTIVLWGLFICASSVYADPLQVNGQLIYDEKLAVYWTKSEKTDNALTWEAAKNWIKGLNKKKFGGYSDWRLPYTPDGTWGYDGGNDGKYNVTVSELGHLYYTTLELSAQKNGTGNSAEELKEATAPFENLLPVLYWFDPLSDTRLNISSGKPNGDPAAWVFDFGYGSQFLQTTNMTAYALAVRSASSVPEPSSVVLFLTGVFVVSRIRARQNY